MSQQKTLKVTNVMENFTHNSKGIKIHRVTFEVGNGESYIAEEANASGVCSFTKGEWATFSITHPGNNGNKDWIRFEGSTLNPEKKPITRDRLDCARVGVMAASQLGLALGWEEEHFREKSFEFSKLIYEIAEKL